MMKINLREWVGVTLMTAGLLATASVNAFIYETGRELFSTGDFDGDGLKDLVIHDRASGKYRIGYRNADGTYQWGNHRLSGVKDATGLTVGRLLDEKKDAILVSAADANLIHLIDAANRGSGTKPVLVPYELLGPGAVVALDIGGAGAGPLHDLVVASVYNEPNQLTLLRNDRGSIATTIAEMEIAEQLSRAQRVGSEAQGIEFLAGIWTGDDGASLRVHEVRDGTAKLVGEIKDLAKGVDFLVGNFRGEELPEVVFYTHATTNTPPGSNESTVWYSTVVSVDDGVTFGPLESIDLGKPIKLAVPVPGETATRLAVIFGKGEEAAIFSTENRDGPIQTLVPKSGDLFFGLVPTDNGFVLFSAPDYSKYATHVEAYVLASGQYSGGAHAELPSMADNDDGTVPEARKAIVETLNREGIKAAGDMKSYTNTIPGTKVSYVMIPVAGGEFVMGSPEGEVDRKADEGPVRKVKVSPFWMAQIETTWNLYELFMYPDDEKKLRVDYPTEEYLNLVSDAVTRPSKPYMEMSFGMGKDGFPAISMSQHAANKFCHWLSTKTGHFYRLPTEAEWEYACRAGTTTAYSFGDDAAKLSEFAWFEDNSDFKYQKVGRKKPNAWGFYDLHGNVAEWCLDQYEDSYDVVQDLLQDPWNKSTKPYPHVVRGGSFDDPVNLLRSAARRASTRDWKMRDPQLPKSIWWLTDAQFLGFRVVRPLNVPPVEQLQKYWTSGVERD
ncbi:MAG: formylglycine-generating enzyme family protein [Limisphaerales bacterium]